MIGLYISDESGYKIPLISFGSMDREKGMAKGDFYCGE